MKILITGSRKFVDIAYIYKILRKELVAGDVIIHGGALGVDNIAQSFCDGNSFNTIIMKSVFPSKKEYYLYRNTEMIGMCDRVIAFWDGVSRGTDFTVRYARKRGMDVKVYKGEVNRTL